MTKIIKLLIPIFFAVTTYSQDFLTIPVVFNQQFQTSILKEIERSPSYFESIIKNTKVDNYWVVYSDREDNYFYDNANGNKKGVKAKYLQAFLVSEFQGNWLHLYDYIELEELGWVHSSKLLLSTYSLLTNQDLEKGIVSIPRKAIILTNIENANSNTNKKYYYKHPNLNTSYKDGSPKKFQSLFIFKESRDAVLLGVSDNIGSQGSNKKGQVHGWIKKKDIENWDTRVALENSNTDEAKEVYGKNTFNGYFSINELELCLDQQACSDKSSRVEISIGPTRNNVMRRPILSNVSENIYQVVSVLGNKEGSKAKEAQLVKSQNLQEKVNIVFVLDATSSMRPYYKSIAKSLERVIDNNQKIIKSSLKVGVVIYRDYLDGKDSYNVFNLSTDYNKVKEFINSTKCQSKDSDLPEAQYNGLINGLQEVGFKEDESNIVVLVGDCGNHLVDQKGYKLKQITDIYDKYECNIISFQVDSRYNYTYFKFNKDVLNSVSATAKNRVKGSGVNARFKSGKNIIKLSMSDEGVDDFESMFSVIVYADGQTMPPKLLEKTIEKSLTDYILSIEKNINILSQYVWTGGPTGSKPPPGIIAEVMKTLNYSEEEAIDFLKKTELTSKAYVALDYNGSGVPTQIPVVLFTESEKQKITKSLRKLTEDAFGTSEQKQKFQENVILVCKSIVGQNTPDELINSLTMNQVWNLIFGVDFGNKSIKNLKLSDLKDKLRKKAFKKFYKEFESVAEDFCDESYIHTDPFKSRRFSVAGSYLFWIPLQDLPGCKVE